MHAESSVSPSTTGIVLVDHGSRRAESNANLVQVAELFRQLTSWTIVEPAHMELAEPSIATAIARCAAQGAQLVVVFPYLLAPGRHWKDDIPRLAAQAAAQHPGLRHVVTAPLGLHPSVIQVVDERIAHCLRRVQNLDAPCDVCDAHSGCTLR